MTGRPKLIAVLAPDIITAREDFLRCAKFAEAQGLNPKFTHGRAIIDLPATRDRPEGTRFQWVLPDQVVEVEGARFDEWAPIEGYRPGPEAWRMVRALQHAVALTKAVAE